MNYLELEGAMSEREAKFVFFQQLLAVDYLHQRNVTRKSAVHSCVFCADKRRVFMIQLHRPRH